MSFESVYRSKSGATEINKITDFMSSLVIKNNYEAEAAETSATLGEYYKYYCAYTRTDNFEDYSIDERQNYKKYAYVWLSNISNKKYDFNESIMDSLSLAKSKILNEKYNLNLPLYIDYLHALRLARVALYDEKNLYYRQFVGKPNSPDDYIYLINYDVSPDGYVEVTNFDEPPNKDILYYTKNINNEYVSIGNLSTWFTEPDEYGDVELLYENFYFFNTILAHELSYKKNPETYSYYILQEHIESIIEENPDKTYLRFISKNFTPYYLRNLDNYSIIDYKNNILSGDELHYFLKSYNKAKSQVIMDYIGGFDKSQPLYNLLMIENLLYYTVINYSNTYIEKYSLGIYTEEDLNNILNSNGYSKLTKIKDVELKRRIVKNMNDLISNKANNDILKLILDRILQDSNAELKRYYIEKEYKTNIKDASIDIDTSKGLGGSVKLTFREVPAISINELSTSKDVYRDYDSFITDDNLWGGIVKGDSSETILTKKKYIKNEILKLNFNSILTRYITLTRSVDILDAQRKLRDSIYLMLKYFDDRNSPEFFESKIDFRNAECTPAGLFGAMCYLQQMKTYDDPDTIIKDNCIITSSVVFRRLGKLGVDRQSFENVVIYDGKPLVEYNISPEIADWKVADFIKENPDIFEDFKQGVDGERIETIRLKDAITLGKISPDGYKHLGIDDETIDDYITVFRFYSGGMQLGDVNNNTTFSEIINDYNNQFPNLIKRITLKLRNSYDYREYQAWLYMLSQSRKNNSIYFIFKNHTKYSEYITDMDSAALLPLIKSSVSKDPKKKLESISTLLNDITNTFKEWVNNSFSELVYKYNEMNDSTSNDNSYIKDMILLFNEFLSVFSELYGVDYNYTFGNKEIDGLSLQLFYNPTNIMFSDKYNDYVNLVYKQMSKFKDDLDSDNISLDYYLSIFEKTTFIDAINKNLTYDKKTNKYIPDDILTYIHKLKFKDLFNELFELKSSLGISALKQLPDDTLNILSGDLIITDNTGDKKHYYA